MRGAREPDRSERLAGDHGDGEALLADELHHRLQNTLAVVLALSRITARSTTTMEAFQAAFGARIQAMARTNALLRHGRVQAASVRAVLELELDVYDGEGAQISLACEAMPIAAEAALNLSLLIHELATNAAKYGGLATPKGRLDVRCWRADDRAVLTWRETAPGLQPHAGAPGQGTALIRRLARALGGMARIEIAPRGLEATVTFEPGGPGAAADALPEPQAVLA